MTVNGGDVNPNRQGFYKKFSKELRGTFRDFTKEAGDNSIEYSSDPPEITYGIIPIGEGRNIIYVFDDSDGILEEIWLRYCSEIEAHLDERGKVGKFGEGVRKAGLSASCEEPKRLFTLTKALNENTKYVLYKLTTKKDEENLRWDKEIPDWIQSFPYNNIFLNIKEHGTKQLVLVKMVDFNDLKEFLTNEYALGLRENKMKMHIIFHKPNSLEVNMENQIVPSTYNSTSSESWTIDLSGINIPVTAFLGVKGEYSKNGGSRRPQGGQTRFFVNGILIKVDRTRRDDVIVEVDMTDSVRFCDAIIASKDSVLEDASWMTCDIINAQIASKYKDRSEKTENEKATEITDKILQDLIKNHPNLGGANLVEVEGVIPHNPHQFQFRCLDCGNKWFSESQKDDTCPKCGKHNVKWIILHPHIPDDGVKGNNELGKQKKKRGRRRILSKTIITIPHIAGGGKTFITFDYPTISFDTDHELHMKLDKVQSTISSQIYRAFISLITRLWGNKKLRHDEEQKATLEMQLEDLSNDYLSQSW